jgi:osmotically-inducible protein OsmY
MNTNYRRVLVAVVAALLLTCATVYASEVDDRIESSANNSYVFKTYLKGDDIKIESKDGIVTLTGTVADEARKSLARETVASLPEVKSVDNRLELSSERPDENSDAWLGLKVKLVLLFHRNVNGAKTEVDVKDGIVTLRGEAASEAQKELTTEYAKDVENVNGVKNEMKVVEPSEELEETLGEKIDDASITAQVKMSLLFHRATSAINTQVETTDGVVTVSGKAENAAEKDLVTKLVTDINGVTSVVNNMTIE